jgi:hypothetical protein
MKTSSKLALAMALGLAGCSADYVQDGHGPVLLIIAGVDPNPLSSEVLLAGGICPDFVELAIANRSKNPNVTVPQVPQAIIVNRYEVSYYRSDGRATQGVDVPYSISGDITAAFDAKTSGTDPLIIEVVRRQAKLEPPLIQLRTDAGGGQALIVTMFAKITLYGQTIARQSVTATATMQIDFADYVDSGEFTTCELPD